MIKEPVQGSFVRLGYFLVRYSPSQGRLERLCVD